MKKLGLVVLTVLSVLASSSRSQAGILIGVANGDAFQGAAVGALIGASAGIVATTIGEIASPGSSEGIYILFAAAMGGMGAVAGAILDVDATQKTNQLTLGFKKALPFIDNTEALENLAHLTHLQLKTLNEQNPDANEAFVQLSREEVTEALSIVDLTQDELDQAVRVFE